MEIDIGTYTDADAHAGIDTVTRRDPEQQAGGW